MSEFVFISGVSTGIGRDACRKLLQEGYQLIVTVRKENDRMELLNEFQDKLHCIICDITKQNELELCKQEVANIFNVTKRTLQNWLNAYENNTLSRKKKICKSYKVKEKHIKLALSLIKKYPHISIQSLWIMLRKNIQILQLHHNI